MNETDEADYHVLSRANANGKFAVPVAHDPPLPPELQEAFERGINNRWYELADVTYIAAVPGLNRIFRLTTKGKTRLLELQELVLATDRHGDVF